MDFKVLYKNGDPVTYDLHDKLKDIFPWEEIEGGEGDIKIVYDVGGIIVDLNYNKVGTVAQFYMFDEEIKKFFEKKANVKLKKLEDVEWQKNGVFF